ncbi:uncharacterized protein [Prorops nasuta]|uniref:uncharacterized protein n=1 Tax=Prorops nasuta TaxID=863751 RepID=UPI0034CFDA0D
MYLILNDLAEAINPVLINTNGKTNNAYLQSELVENIISNYSDETFFSHFRMTKETFLVLEEVLRPFVTDGPVSVRHKILLGIWTLATPDSFRCIAHIFQISRSMAHIIFKEVVLALKNIMPQYVKWPTTEEYLESSIAFNARSNGFPNMIGAIDGCHIAIKQPPGNAHDYFNRKDFHSIILQGICDRRGKFLDCLIGRPGRAHDAAVFRSSIIYEKLTDSNNPLIPSSYHILGDSAYPLLPCLMTPFKDNGHLSSEQINYNVRHASSRSIIERAFAFLKGKWRRLKFVEVNSVQMANNIIAAACTLHNFLILRNEMNVALDI